MSRVHKKPSCSAKPQGPIIIIAPLSSLVPTSWEIYHPIFSENSAKMVGDCRNITDRTQTERRNGHEICSQLWVNNCPFQVVSVVAMP